MARKTAWKEVHIRSHNEWNRLKSCLGSFAELKQYKIQFEGGMLIIETNLPWSLFRQWFSFAGVRFPSDVLVADQPSWEIYKDEA